MAEHVIAISDIDEKTLARFVDVLNAKAEGKDVATGDDVLLTLVTAGISRQREELVANDRQAARLKWESLPADKREAILIQLGLPLDYNPLG